MDFSLPEEHRLVQETVSDFCNNEVEPIAQEIEDNKRFPNEIFEKLCELDMMGILVDEEWGGINGGYLMYSLVAEELGKVSGSIGLSYIAHSSLGTKPIEKYGSEEQKEEWLQPLVEEGKIGAWAMTEPNSGSDASAMETVAKKDGDEFIINGLKQFITNASVADCVLLKSKVEDEQGSNEGITTFLIDPNNDDGFTVTKEWDKMGLHASPTCEIQIDNCRVTEKRVLGEVGEGWEQAKKSLTGGRISVAALSVGLATGAYEAALSYAQEREQFGKKISEFDVIRNKLVEMYRKIERSRLLTRKAAKYYDNSNQAANKYASLAKLEASESSREVSEQAVQIHGGYGYTTEYPVQRFYRDSKLMEIGEGTTEIQYKILGNELDI